MIGVVGCGKVGRSHLYWLASRGWEVKGFDVLETVRDQVAEDLGASSVARNFDELAQCEAVHICVPTDPSADGSADLSIIEEVVKSLADLENSSDAELRYVSQRSTCPPGSADLLASSFSRIHYGVNPSFLRKTAIETDTRTPERIAYGGSEEFARHMESIYCEVEAPTFASTSRSLIELLKYVENSLDSVLISYWNEILSYADRLNISSRDFSTLLERIGDRPKFASSARVPGFAFGMWCLPKDLIALLQEMNSRLAENALLSGALATNRRMLNNYGEGELGGTQLFSWVDGKFVLSENGRRQLSERLDISD